MKTEQVQTTQRGVCERTEIQVIARGSAESWTVQFGMGPSCGEANGNRNSEADIHNCTPPRKRRKLSILDSDNDRLHSRKS